MDDDIEILCESGPKASQPLPYVFPRPQPKVKGPLVELVGLSPPTRPLLTELIERSLHGSVVALSMDHDPTVTHTVVPDRNVGASCKIQLAFHTTSFELFNRRYSLGYLNEKMKTMIYGAMAHGKPVVYESYIRACASKGKMLPLTTSSGGPNQQYLHQFGVESYMWSVRNPTKKIFQGKSFLLVHTGHRRQACTQERASAKSLWDTIKHLLEMGGAGTISILSPEELSQRDAAYISKYKALIGDEGLILNREFKLFRRDSRRSGKLEYYNFQYVFQKIRKPQLVAKDGASCLLDGNRQIVNMRTHNFSRSQMSGLPKREPVAVINLDGPPRPKEPILIDLEPEDDDDVQFVRQQRKTIVYNTAEDSDSSTGSRRRAPVIKKRFTKRRDLEDDSDSDVRVQSVGGVREPPRRKSLADVSEEPAVRVMEPPRRERKASSTQVQEVIDLESKNQSPNVEIIEVPKVSERRVPKEKVARRLPEVAQRLPEVAQRLPEVAQRPPDVDVLPEAIETLPKVVEERRLPWVTKNKEAAAKRPSDVQVLDESEKPARSSQIPAIGYAPPRPKVSRKDPKQETSELPRPSEERKRSLEPEDRSREEKRAKTEEPPTAIVVQRRNSRASNDILSPLPKPLSPPSKLGGVVIPPPPTMTPKKASEEASIISTDEMDTAPMKPSTQKPSTISHDKGAPPPSMAPTIRQEPSEKAPSISTDKGVQPPSIKQEPSSKRKKKKRDAVQQHQYVSLISSDEEEDVEFDYVEMPLPIPVKVDDLTKKGVVHMATTPAEEEPMPPGIVKRKVDVTDETILCRVLNNLKLRQESTNECLDIENAKRRTTARDKFKEDREVLTIIENMQQRKLDVDGQFTRTETSIVDAALENFKSSVVEGSSGPNEYYQIALVTLYTVGKHVDSFRRPKNYMLHNYWDRFLLPSPGHQRDMRLTASESSDLANSATELFLRIWLLHPFITVERRSDAVEYFRKSLLGGDIDVDFEGNDEFFDRFHTQLLAAMKRPQSTTTRRQPAELGLSLMVTAVQRDLEYWLKHCVVRRSAADNLERPLIHFLFKNWDSFEDKARTIINTAGESVLTGTATGTTRESFYKIIACLAIWLGYIDSKQHRTRLDDPNSLKFRLICLLQQLFSRVRTDAARTFANVTLLRPSWLSLAVSKSLLQRETGHGSIRETDIGSLMLVDLDESTLSRLLHARVVASALDCYKLHAVHRAVWNAQNSGSEVVPFKKLTRLQKDDSLEAKGLKAEIGMDCRLSLAKEELVGAMEKLNVLGEDESLAKWWFISP